MRGLIVRMSARRWTTRKPPLPVTIKVWLPIEELQFKTAPPCSVPACVEELDNHRRSHPQQALPDHMPQREVAPAPQRKETPQQPPEHLPPPTQRDPRIHTQPMLQALCTWRC